MYTNNLNILFRNLALVAIATISTGTLAACNSSTSPESSVSNTPVAVTPKATPTTHMSKIAMDLGPADANFDLRFIDAMIPHHQGAVDMAKEAQQKSQRPEIKKLADNIIKAQTKEIAELQTWRKKWYASASKPMAYDAKKGSMMEMNQDQIHGMMMSQDLGAKDAEFDLRFINAMIPHHKSAITMAQDASAKSTHPEIKQLAQDIISSQQAEIKQMRQWRQAWYKK